MGRHIKPFENFTEEKKVKKVYLLFSDEHVVNAEGVFATKREAERERKELIDFCHDRYDSDIRELRKIFMVEGIELEDHKEVMEVYNLILATDDRRRDQYSSSARDILLSFISLGASFEDLYLLVKDGRMTSDELIKRLKKILGEDLGMLPNGPFKDKLLRMQRGKSAFGM